MKSLEKIRETIDSIDSEIRVLFEKRMDSVMRVIEYKYTNNEKIFDEKREQAVIEKNVSQLKNKDYQESYQLFIKEMMALSKAYQKEWIEKKSAR